ncbi:hypothetical protein, partial [Mycolicibacterium fortuitum]|uniref:hypothetical protein n=1 Tax=Mycolicibacterium fortuitum TaxID=1766 RepID=UPI001C11855F
TKAQAEFESEKSDHKQKTPNKLASKNNNHTLNGKKSVAKNNKQKPPNTLLSSQTTRPSLSRRNPAAKSR